MRHVKWVSIHTLALLTLVSTLGCCRSQPAASESAAVQQIDIEIWTRVHQMPHYRLNAAIIQYNQGGQYPADRFAGPGSPQLLAQFSASLKATGILDISPAVTANLEAESMDVNTAISPVFVSVDYADGRTLKYSVVREKEIISGTPFAAFFTWLQAFEREARKRSDAHTPLLDD